RLDAFRPDIFTSYKTQVSRNAPLKAWGGGLLGVLIEDKSDIVIHSYAAPVVRVRLETPDGGRPNGAGGSAGFTINGASFGEGSFLLQPDGLYRSSGLMPDHEYTIDAHAEEYEPATSGPLVLKEGSDQVLTLRLGPKKAAWEILTLDGKEQAYEEYKGKY